MAAESGELRASKFRALAQEHGEKADRYRALAEACEKGNVGEHQVARLLDILEGSGWFVLNDRYKSVSSPANIDHILIGPPGVCVIDTKNWTSGRLRLDERGMAMGRYRRDDELHSAKVAADIIHSHAVQAVPGVVTAPVLAFAQDVGLEAPTLHQSVVCLQAEQMLPWLTSLPRNLTPQQVHQLASSLDAAFLPRTGARRPLTLADMGPAGRPARRPRQPSASGARSARPSVSRTRSTPVRTQVARTRPSSVRTPSLVFKELALAAVAVVLLMTVGVSVVVPLVQKGLANAVARVIPAPAPSSVETPPAISRR